MGDVLSEGAFRLFAWLCMRAHRPSGQLDATQRELAVALGRSRRALSGYIAELEQKGVCWVKEGSNQYARTRFEIADSYWPYDKAGEDQSRSDSMAKAEQLSDPATPGA